MKKHIGLPIILLLFVICPQIAFPQTGNGEEKKAEALHRKYEFDQALVIYKKVLESCTDSLKMMELEKKLIQSENGLSLLEFAFEPGVVAKQRSQRGSFFLRYPGFEQKSWVKLPQQFAFEADITTGEFPVMQFVQSSRSVIFSAPDNTGAWNLYTSRLLNDTLWSVPNLLNENITTAGNEIFPVISPDGKTLYFSSDGHSGVGGYDLYVSQWDEDSKDWGMPQNMGFPYSSPADDLFFYNTPDGLYSVFASNRDCSADSVIVYALDYENVPLKKSVTPAQAAAIAKLPVKAGSSAGAAGVSAGTTGAAGTADAAGVSDANLSGQNDFSQYTLAVNNVRKLQKELADIFAKQTASRELYNTLKNEDDLRALEKQIEQQELATMSLQNEVNAALAQVQKLEMEFLSKGMFVPQVEEKPVATAENKSAGTAGFAFVQMALGDAPSVIVEQPEPEVDLSFKITDEDAQVFDVSEIPQGLVYQIQLFAVSKKATIKSLKGMSPVFERKYPSGKYIYSVGIFKTYSDALSNLNKVRKRGFSSAMVVAFRDGKSMPLKDAKILEKELANSGVSQVWIEGYDVLPQDILAVIRNITEKDIAKANVDGQLRYVIGPFGNEEDAKILRTGLKAVSDKTIEVEKVK